MEQICRSDPGANYRGAEKPEHSASRASSNNSERLASLAIVPIGNGHGSRPGYATDHGAGGKQLMRISQMRAMQPDDTPDMAAGDLLHRRTVPQLQPNA
jgi:hypothetical protein